MSGRHRLSLENRAARPAAMERRDALCHLLAAAHADDGLIVAAFVVYHLSTTPPR